MVLCRMCKNVAKGMCKSSEYIIQYMCNGQVYSPKCIVFPFKAALFFLMITIVKMTTCNVKEVGYSNEFTDNYNQTL